MFGDRHRGQRCHLPKHGTLVAGSDHGDGFREIAAERVFDEFAHLTAALAHQRDHHFVEGVGPRQHGEQRRLADAGACEDAEALSEAERGEDVYRPHTRLESVLHPLACHGRGRHVRDRAADVALQQHTQTVYRLGQRVDGAAAPLVGRRYAEGTLANDDIMDADRVPGFDRADDHPLGLDADDFAEMGSGCALMRDEVAKPNVPRQTADGVMPGRDRLDMTPRARWRIPGSHSARPIRRAPPATSMPQIFQWLHVPSRIPFRPA